MYSIMWKQAWRTAKCLGIVYICRHSCTARAEWWVFTIVGVLLRLRTFSFFGRSLQRRWYTLHSCGASPQDKFDGGQKEIIQWKIHYILYMSMLPSTLYSFVLGMVWNILKLYHIPTLRASIQNEKFHMFCGLKKCKTFNEHLKSLLLTTVWTTFAEEY